MSFRSLIDHFRCPEEFLAFDQAEQSKEPEGVFSIGPNTKYYGHCSGIHPIGSFSGATPDVLPLIGEKAGLLSLPFDADEIVSNLHFERYLAALQQPVKALQNGGLVRELYYLLRPVLPVPVRKHLQKLKLRGWQEIPFPHWPVDFSVDLFMEALIVRLLSMGKFDRIPFVWFWPDELPSATTMTHDIEALAGRDFCGHLMDLNDRFHVKSSFQVVPEERYDVPSSFLESIRTRGFEVNVHDLNHDGRLFQEKSTFLKRATRINEYAREFGAQGFRAGAMYRNQDWLSALDVSYDMSVPNVAHLEPQRGGCCSILPYFNGNILEIPLTVTQDYSLFHVIGDYSTSLWEKQINLILQRHGLISFITHPDYLIEKSARAVYTDLLRYLSTLRDTGKTWIALPGKINGWWRSRSKMRLVKSSSGRWEIEGSGDEKRARVAYAQLCNGEFSYTFDV